MEQTIKHLTQLWLSKLPKSYKHIGVDELKRALLPMPLIHRIRREVIHSMRDSLKPPVSEWVDHTTPEFKAAWATFVSQNEAHIRIPKAQMDGVMQVSVSDLLESLVRPRAAIPAQLLRDKNKATLESLQIAKERIVANRHLPFAVVRYVEKNQLEELTKKECQMIVAEVDRRICAKYILSEWESALEPIFDLFGGEVEAKMIRLFFEDKEIQEAAAAFESIDNALRAKDIRPILRPIFFPELRNVTASSYSREEPTRHEEAGEEQAGSDPREAAREQQTPQSGAVRMDATTPGEDEDVTAAISHPAEIESEEEVFFSRQEDEDSEFTLADRFRKQEDQPSVAERFLIQPDPEPDEDASEVQALFDTFVEQEQEKEQAQEQAQPPRPDTRGPSGGIPTGVTASPGSPPSATPTRSTIEDTSKAPDHPPSLEEWLVLDRQRFIEVIFGGAESAYDLAIEDLESILDWKLASRYIEKEIFSRNMIDMFEETAIDFTDRLQSYFIEYK